MTGEREVWIVRTCVYVFVCLFDVCGCASVCAFDVKMFVFDLELGTREWWSIMTDVERSDTAF